jgi:dTDP-4-amino-4,6-dideoxygalactose transaminase
VVGVESGRGALALALSRLRAEAPGRCRVAIPGFTCPTVAFSVRAAGAQPLFCDVDPQTMTYDVQALCTALAGRTDVLAVVLPYHFGLPADPGPILEAAARQAVPVVEDAAQAFGATANGRPVGTAGVFGVFSLGKGKSLTAWSGGLLCGPEPRIRSIPLRDPPLALDLARLALLLLYPWVLHPALWRFTGAAVLRKASHVEEAVPMPPAALSAFQCAFADCQLARFAGTKEARNARAERYREFLAGTAAATPVPPACVKPAYTAFPVLLPDVDAARRVKHVLWRSGLGRSIGTWEDYDLGRRFPDSPCMPDLPGAADVGRRLITLPVHHLVRDEDQSAIVDALRRAL